MVFTTENETDLQPNTSVHYVLTLSHLSRNTLAKVFWTTPTMKNLMKTIFIDNNPVNDLSPIRRRVVFTAQTLKWFKQKLFPGNVKGSLENNKERFFSGAYEQLNNTILPPVARNQLRIAVRISGENVFNSLNDISKMISGTGTNSLHMEDFIDNLCLTNSGSVDYPEIFKKINLAEPAEVDYYMFILACELCLEEYIWLWSPNLQESTKKRKLVKMGKLIFEDLKKGSDVANYSHFWTSRRAFRYSYYGHFLMYWKLWKCQHMTKADWSLFLAAIQLRSRIDFYDQWHIYDLRDSIEENMFRVSVVIGNFQAVKYFWNKLSSDAKSLGLRKMTGIACWYEWNLRYPFLGFTLQCDKFLPKRTQFFDIIYFLIQNMSQLEFDELFNFPIGLHRLQQNVLKDFMPLVFLVNHGKCPEFCVNIAKKSFEYVGNKPFTDTYLHIMENLLEVLHQDSELHGIDAFDIFYEFWRLSPVDEESKTRSYLQWYWVHYKKWHFVSVLEDVIYHPDSPTFVQHYGIFRRWMDILFPSRMDYTDYSVDSRYRRETMSM